MKRLGIFGGTFDPIHRGHLHLAREFFQRLELDSLLLVPTKRPTHKSAPHLADAQHRLAMCRLAVEPFGYAVSDIEVNRDAASYTVLTLQEIGRQYPGWELFFLMGEDMFWTVERWKEPEKIFRLAQLCVAPRSREEDGMERLSAYAEELRRKGARVRIEPIPYFPVSSTDVRKALENDGGLEGLVPPAVESYIRVHQVYDFRKGLQA